MLGALSRGPLHRAQISFAAMWASESAFMVSLAVVAYGEGGVTAVGVVTAARMATAAFLGPFLATLADRVRRERVLTCVGVVRGAMLACAAAVTASGGPATATYAFAIVATVAVALYRPAHSALLPSLAKSPEDLTRANAVRGMLDSLSTLGGPLVAAVLLAASGPATAFAACAAASLLGGLVVVALPYDEPPRAAAVRGSAGRDVVQGFATIAGDRTLSLITALGVVQTLTRGCLTVFTVVLAIDLLDTGDPGVGVLNAAVGAGGVLGSLFAFTLVRRGGLARWFGVGIALFGAPLALIGAVPEQVAAITLLALVGVGNALIDVGGFTILARMTDEAVLARMFAGFEAILTLGFALGGLVAPVLIQGLGPRAALVVVGLLAPVAVAASWTTLRRLDGRLCIRTSLQVQSPPPRAHGQPLHAATSIVRAGYVTARWPRTTTTEPSSSGWRRASRAARPNSGSSSRNRTPWCASVTSPGLGGTPPPTRPDAEIVWWGARNGRFITSPPRARPATPCTLVISIASAIVGGGRIPGSRRASIVLPAPGGPTMRRLCPPAAAISSARRASS